jgi:hypothetical protein
MKVQEIIRGSVVVMGLGIALFFASPVRAQQDVNPDTFDVKPGTSTEVAVVAQVPAPAPVAAQDNGVAQPAIMPASNWVILAVGTGLVALYTVAATRRQRRRASPVQSNA